MLDESDRLTFIQSLFFQKRVTTHCRALNRAGWQLARSSSSAGGKHSFGRRVPVIHERIDVSLLSQGLGIHRGEQRNKRWE